MCLILFAYQHHPDFPLIVAANRDEFYQRPTQAGHFWPEAPSLFAGRDLEAGGTWMGVNKQGRFAAVTNYRENTVVPADAISRGNLCSDFLRSDNNTVSYLQSIDQQKQQYAGFNLLAGTMNQLYYYSNRQGEIKPLAPGVHGLSNSLLNTSWPKVDTGVASLENIIASTTDPKQILTLLLDQQRASDHELPSTGIDIEMERMLSSRFIQSENYGTRSSTVLCVDRNGGVAWLEQSFDAKGVTSGIRSHSF
ncbi:MAG: NRDE family protein [Oceanicoccus sp.]|uniref:NRDE family protein n=1 Tax=Oceanicoccus sp. TaxID=2691044 RepID=UPI0026225F4D|nr:NRDE family protein [Oceanicoccus sp.]MCP3906602.1 NRDE family protein [Oceanicoccus sp.]